MAKSSSVSRRISNNEKKRPFISPNFVFVVWIKIAFLQTM
jgi:hypothetical protein